LVELSDLSNFKGPVSPFTLGFIWEKAWFLLGLIWPASPSVNGNESLFFADAIESLSDVPGLCFGVLYDLDFALADSVGAM